MPVRHLTPRDQHLFWRYGRGADVPVHEPLVHRAIERHAIAHPHAVAAVLSGIDPADCPHLRTVAVAVAGKPCPRPLADRWPGRAAFFHCRGPAGTALATTVGRRSPTAGRPLPNSTVYVLGADRRPLPIGETGEMWAGGDCVPAGCPGDDILNAERYAPDPFLGAGRTMFRTRGLGRWTPDGDLEHLGHAERPLPRLAAQLPAGTAPVNR